MKFTPPLLIALCLLAQPLFAADGVLIVEKTTTGGTTRTSQIQIEKTRMRAESESPTGGRRIFVFDGGAQLMRVTILAIAVLFIFGFAGLTISTIATEGLTLGGVVAVFIIVLMLVGIVGALRNPPR